MVDYEKWVGCKVQKISGKPFKSGLKVNTIKFLTNNPDDPKERPAFTFEEDESVVNAHQLELTKE